MIVGRICNGYAQKILMFVDCGDNGAEYQQKLSVVLRTFAWIEKVYAGVGGQRPVVVFSAAVDSGKRFFVKKTSHVVFGRDFLHDFHRELVLVGGNVDGCVNGGKFVLTGCNFVVFGLCKNAEFPQFFVKFFHIFDHARLYCAEIVI